MLHEVTDIIQRVSEYVDSMTDDVELRDGLQRVIQYYSAFDALFKLNATAIEAYDSAMLSEMLFGSPSEILAPMKAFGDFFRNLIINEVGIERIIELDMEMENARK